MTTLQQAQTSVRPTIKGLVAVALANLIPLSGVAIAAAPTGFDRTVNVETVREAFRPNCVTARTPAETRNEQDKAEPASEAKGVCRLAAAVALSIRNNPAIF